MQCHVSCAPWHYPWNSSLFAVSVLTKKESGTLGSGVVRQEASCGQVTGNRGNGALLSRLVPPAKLTDQLMNQPPAWNTCFSSAEVRLALDTSSPHSINTVKFVFGRVMDAGK